MGGLFSVSFFFFFFWHLLGKNQRLANGSLCDVSRLFCRVGPFEGGGFFFSEKRANNLSVEANSLNAGPDARLPAYRWVLLVVGAAASPPSLRGGGKGVPSPNVFF